MLDFLTDQNFLSVLSLAIGPLAFFAAPCEEIELLLLSGDMTVDVNEADAADVPAIEVQLAPAQH